MSVTVYFANISKKRNSTLQGTFSTSYDCTLKAPTSLDRPTFLISAETMDYNAAKYGNRYYFIDDVVSVRQGQWEVTCILDVLATYKSAITSSSQFVLYSSAGVAESYWEWIPDTRLGATKRPQFDMNDGSVPIFDVDGFYVLTVNGKEGCEAYVLTQAQIKLLINQVNTWQNDGITAIIAGTAVPGVTYNWGNTQECIESLSKILTQTGFIGNSFSNAPQMIRSCIWVPFKASYFESAGSNNIWLGNFDTGISVHSCTTKAVTNSTAISISIPWIHAADWRRGTMENVYMYLPFVGVIQLSADEIAEDEKIYIYYSATATDGVIAYELRSEHGRTIGTYGGSCCANYPIGINQQASAGQIFQTALGGLEKTVGSISGAGVLGTVTGVAWADAALTGAQAIFDTQNVRYSTTPSCIGSFGGGAGSGMPLDIKLQVVGYQSIENPGSAYSLVMGVPVMKYKTLGDLYGFCQCANAHVAVAAQAREIDAIDTYLNTGFFIE